MSRATARVAAMQMIFEQMAGGQGGEETLQLVYEQLREEPEIKMGKDDPNVEDRAWIQTVLEGVLDHVDELDDKINAASHKWRTDRMPHVDLTILRLAAWEILYEEGVPGSVVINEAVELANRFSEEGSGRFINGVLGTILRGKATAQ